MKQYESVSNDLTGVNTQGTHASHRILAVTRAKNGSFEGSFNCSSDKVWRVRAMAEDSTLPRAITLRPDDIQVIVAGLAANPKAMATVAQSASTTAPSEQPASSLSSQGSIEQQVSFHYHHNNG